MSPIAYAHAYPYADAVHSAHTAANGGRCGVGTGASDEFGRGSSAFRRWGLRSLS